ncbi:MAG: Uma2 family endonuclease [Leptolyngbyaceae cyanobacterium SM1_1_3]|nr:Uma2 family endonuclease [Leptolyngbyaceae cyanobacterium SM1_1_3]NJN02887.1 Uma2 family endonuclease [Leptolyngbyaceae cyanobacterium RM1_1_2]NJO11566.1 Uma2 family endonuclease [Leptolyngbyaceae cyanobacterium SL_1_1]
MVLADPSRILETEAGPVLLPPSDLLSDEPPLESYLHLQQMLLLLNCLDWLWRERNDYFAAGNLTIYYSAQQQKSADFRGPDFFVVLDTKKQPRKSWIVWEEDGKYPNLIVELLSHSTAKTDRGLKQKIYQDIFRTPEYFWFSPDTLEFQGFVLERGTYQPIVDEQGYLWSAQLQLFLGVYERQLRFFSAEKQLMPSPQEAAIASNKQAEVERQQAEVERQQAKAERRRNEKLVAKLRELGIDPAELD